MGSTLAVSLSRQDGNLDIYTLDLEHPGAYPPDGRAGHRYRARLVPGRASRSTSRRMPRAVPRSTGLPADGGNAQRVTFEGTYNARPRLAPDGKQLAVVHNDRGNYRIAAR